MILTVKASNTPLVPVGKVVSLENNGSEQVRVWNAGQIGEAPMLTLEDSYVQWNTDDVTTSFDLFGYFGTEPANGAMRKIHLHLE